MNINLRAVNDKWVRVEILGKPHFIMANGETPDGWQTFILFLLDKKWDEGKRVVLQCKSDTSLYVYGLYHNPNTNYFKLEAGDVDSAMIFTIHKGEKTGSWALSHLDQVVSVDVGYEDNPLYVKRASIKSSESFFVYNADTGELLDHPFDDGSEDTDGTNPLPTDLLNVQSNICNLVSKDNQVILSGFGLSLPSKTDRDDWNRRQKNAGALKTALGIKYFYHNFSDVFPPVIPPGKDWIDDIDGWVRLFWETQQYFNQGIDIFLTQGDGSWDDPNSETRQFCNPSSPTYGPRLVGKILNSSQKQGFPNILNYAAWGFGWEPDPRSFDDCLMVLDKSLPPGRKIFLHEQQGYSHWGKGAGDWQGIGQLVDALYYQALAFEPGKVDQYGQPYWHDNAIETLNRMYPTGTPLPGCAGHIYYDNISDSAKVHPGYALGPDYFGGTAKRARLVFYECINYWFIRNYTNPDAASYVQMVAREARKLGFEYFGTGVPV